MCRSYFENYAGAQCAGLIGQPAEVVQVNADRPGREGVTRTR
jgi:hypothetical protein